MVTKLRVRNALALCLICFGLYGVFAIGNDVKKAINSESWPRVSANLISLTVNHCKVENQARLSIRYEFAVRSKKYSGSTYSLVDQECMERSAADQIARQIQIPGALHVSYNPEDPNQSTIVPGMNDIHWVGGFIVLMLVILFGLLELFFSVDSSGRFHRKDPL